VKINVNMESSIACGRVLTPLKTYKVNNAFLLNNNDGSDLPGGPINGMMLKHYIMPQ
jgi:hypothetical protein